MTGRAFAACVAAAFLAGCGAGGDGGGKAQVWITRDRGRHVLAVRTVPAGLTGMQALDRVAEIETRYGGRFVQSIEGLEGSLTARRDWFYFVNGVEGDRSAAEYRLRDGDIEWWDLRSWKGKMQQPVVVGAFPEPFLHGYGGKTRPAYVYYDTPDLEPAARALGKVIRARAVTRSLDYTAPRGANVLVVVSQIAPGVARFFAERRAGDGAGGTVRFVLSDADPMRLARNPKLARFRYEGLP